MRWLPLMLLAGCVKLQSVSVTQVPAQRTQQVSASAETPLLFMGIGLKPTFADSLVDNLRLKCKNGLISGILTKHEHLTWPLFSRERVTATGWCVR